MDRRFSILGCVLIPFPCLFLGEANPLVDLPDVPGNKSLGVISPRHQRQGAVSGSHAQGAAIGRPAAHD